MQTGLGAETNPEPWLRGPIEGVHPLVMPIFFTFKQVKEDLHRHTAGLTSGQVWRKVGPTSLGFHLKHMVGSVDRLTTYLFGGQLTDEQLSYLAGEPTGSEEIAELITQLEMSFARCEQRLRSLEPAALYESRGVGRKALPTTVIGLIVHLSEHTQRHLGQAITLSQVLRQLD